MVISISGSWISWRIDSPRPAPRRRDPRCRAIRHKTEVTIIQRCFLATPLGTTQKLLISRSVFWPHHQITIQKSRWSEHYHACFQNTTHISRMQFQRLNLRIRDISVCCLLQRINTICHFLRCCLLPRPGQRSKEGMNRQG